MSAEDEKPSWVRTYEQQVDMASAIDWQEAQAEKPVYGNVSEERYNQMRAEVSRESKTVLMQAPRMKP